MTAPIPYRMVTIAGNSADPTHLLVIENPGDNTSLEELPRRVTRTPTLDGGAVIYDGGARHADRTFTVEMLNATREQADIAAEMWEVQTRVIVTCHSGAFECSISRLANEGSSIIFTLLVESKRS